MGSSGMCVCGWSRLTVPGVYKDKLPLLIGFGLHGPVGCPSPSLLQYKVGASLIDGLSGVPPHPGPTIT